MSNFSSTLRQLRKGAKMTQPELANKLGISRSTVSMYELGQREPDFETLEAVADIFNVDMNTLIGKVSFDIPHTSSAQPENIIKIAGRDGSFREKRLDDKGLQALIAFVDLLPDAPDNI